MKSAYSTTHHRDGTVTVWNVFTQSWERMSCAALVQACEQPHGNLVLPTLPERDRRRIIRAAANLT